MQKRRVTITVDADVVEEATRAVAEGRASSVSAWIGEAMVARQTNDRRLEVLGELIAEYEAAHGTITDEELAQQAQADRDSAALVRAELRRAG
ncbi:MAG: hypothetical protein IPH81_12915 [Candidatus Microthrix sp.]|jgi:hypothetical protein|nr:hypothetical protein [Candidatus Microthrix sp.]MBK6438574.1 hypothetical protein [Candidatus Microthrix sp.]MBK6969066.1 hypothetical protein [Candidatus Microthrix sp.]MBK7166136.1 hypothetical protein [Candidatus Microthrix sp.]MBP7594702.1 hypothetical protein [Candidatus Microthrix sp.]